MKIPRGIKLPGLSILAGAVALTTALGFGQGLQWQAAGRSHQQPSPEQLFEVRAPHSPELVARGRKLFLDSCAHCHGADARGDEGPDLHDVQVSDRYIVNTIARGIPHEMPAFAKKHDAADLTA